MSDLSHSIKKSILINGKITDKEELIKVGDKLRSQSSENPDVKVVNIDDAYVELEWINYQKVKRFMSNSNFTKVFKIPLTAFKSSGWRKVH